MPLGAADSSRAANGVDGTTIRTLPRSIVLLLGIAGAVALGFGIKGAAGIIAPTMLAFVLTIAVLPIYKLAGRHRWPNWAAILTALVAGS